MTDVIEKSHAFSGRPAVAIAKPDSEVVGY